MERAVFTPVSFHPSSHQDSEFAIIMSDYLALERARIFRRLLVVRCGLIAIGITVAGAGFGWLSTFATWCSAGLFVVAPAAAWTVELRRERQLLRRVEHRPAKTASLPPSGS